MKVRKKPLVVEARQFTDEPSAYEIAEWCGGDVFVYGAAQRRAMRISTLEGYVLALPGDWIIQGIKGEFYPCKPDIFAATYEPENPAVPLAPPEVERGKCGKCPSCYGKGRYSLQFEDGGLCDRCGGTGREGTNG